MEFVLVMPIFVFTIFGIIQLALVCMAKQLTHYAAYSAARAAIVYNPKDYINSNNVFFMYDGVVHRAAYTALATMGHMPKVENSSKNTERFEYEPLEVPGWGKIPGSGYIANQVTIDTYDSEILPDVPAVKVTVAFRYPLHIPYVGSLIAYFAGGGKADGHWDLTGMAPSDMDKYLRRIEGIPYIVLRESCLLPMPWDNRMFPRAEKSRYLGTEDI